MNEDQLRNELLETQRQLSEARILAIRNESKHRELKAFCFGYATHNHIDPIIKFVNCLEQRNENS